MWLRKLKARASIAHVYGVLIVHDLLDRGDLLAVEA